MTILEALHAKKPLRRASLKGNWLDPDLDIHFTPNDIVATDWEVKPDAREFWLTLQPLGDIMYLVATSEPITDGSGIHVREVLNG